MCVGLDAVYRVRSGCSITQHVDITGEGTTRGVGFFPLLNRVDSLAGGKNSIYTVVCRCNAVRPIAFRSRYQALPSVLCFFARSLILLLPPSRLFRNPHTNLTNCDAFQFVHSQKKGGCVWGGERGALARLPECTTAPVYRNAFRFAGGHEDQALAERMST